MERFGWSDTSLNRDELPTSDASTLLVTIPGNTILGVIDTLPVNEELKSIMSKAAIVILGFIMIQLLKYLLSQLLYFRMKAYVCSKKSLNLQLLQTNLLVHPNVDSNLSNKLTIAYGVVSAVEKKQFLSTIQQQQDLNTKLILVSCDQSDVKRAFLQAIHYSLWNTGSLRHDAVFYKYVNKFIRIATEMKSTGKDIPTVVFDNIEVAFRNSNSTTNLSFLIQLSKYLMVG
jgi:hypothetical protein